MLNYRCDIFYKRGNMKIGFDEIHIIWGDWEEKLKEWESNN